MNEWMDGWIVGIKESNSTDLSEDESVGVLLSFPDSNGVRVNIIPLCIVRSWITPV